jgi:hypothetical protein
MPETSTMISICFSSTIFVCHCSVGSLHTLLKRTYVRTRSRDHCVPFLNGASEQMPNPSNLFNSGIQTDHVRASVGLERELARAR